MLFASEKAPVALLKNPLVLLKSEKTPVAVLKPPLTSLVRARRPVAVFWFPPVRWLSASKPVPVFQTPPVRLTSTPTPSPLLEPSMAPSVSGPTACATGAGPGQARGSGMRRRARIIEVAWTRGKPSRNGDRPIDFLRCRVVIFFVFTLFAEAELLNSYYLLSPVLLIVEHHLWRWFACFELFAHLLNLRCLLF